MNICNITNPHLISLPKILDERGNLSFIEHGKHLDWDIKRVYWISDVPGGEVRGGHAFKKQKELIIALSGSFDVVTYNTEKQDIFTLNRSYQGLYVPNMIWRHIENFSTNAVALIISNTFFSEDDYIRDLEVYMKHFNINE